MERNEIDTTAPLPPAQPAVPSVIAPAWHTALLVIGILAVSIHQAEQFAAPHASLPRLTTYALTGTMELSMLAWIVFGLRLRKISFRSLLGEFSFSFRSIVADIGCALLFWIASLMVLGTFAFAWSGAEAAWSHRSPAIAAGQPPAPSASQRQALNSLAELAPSNGTEVAAWILLCLAAGFCEEVVFRGYLQRQFVAALRGRVAVGVLFSSLCFGAAHGYEGARGMFLIFVFGVLFSLLALYRRSLRPGMIAHAWQDLLAGLALALLKSHHFI